MRYIQGLLGHSRSKTTEIYTNVSSKSLEKIKSPLDTLNLRLSFQIGSNCGCEVVRRYFAWSKTNMKLEERTEEKMQEILDIVKDRIATYSPLADEIAKKIVDSFCVITPPETDVVILSITINSGGIGGGRSLKPGNILLNLKKTPNRWF